MASVRQQVLEAIESPVAPVRSTIAHRLALVAVSLAMVLLPLLYLGLIALIAWGLLEYTKYAMSVAGSSDMRARQKILLFAPILFKSVGIFFMIKPLFAKKIRQISPRSLDPNNEPLLFEFIVLLCKSVHAPIPKRIDVTTEVNAYASFRTGWGSMLRRRDLVLTIGLPLVRGLSVRELSGVLAHEFGHFSQGTSMRLSFLIRSINAWFARVVYERDAWDERLARWAKDFDYRLSLVLYAAMFFVWITRCILWVFMFAGHVVSCLLMRQMEYDADLHEIRLAGSASFASTAIQLRRLAMAQELSSSQFLEFYADGKLVDDIPRWLEMCRDQQSAETVEQITQAASNAKTGWFDTHPADNDRIAFANKQADAGKFRSDLSATVLFQNLDAICRAATEDLYQNNFDQFNRNMLTSVERLAESYSQSQQFSQTYRHLFGSADCLHQFADIDFDDLPSWEAETALRELGQFHSQLQSRIKVYLQLRQQFQVAEQDFGQSRRAMLLCQAGFTLDPKAWDGLDVSKSNVLKAEIGKRHQRMKELTRQLSLYEAAFVKSIHAAACWLKAVPHKTDSQARHLQSQLELHG